MQFSQLGMCYFWCSHTAHIQYNISIYTSCKRKSFFLVFVEIHAIFLLGYVLFLDFEVYPRPRVRIKEQQQEEEEKAENHFSPPNDKGSILFLRVLESLASPDSSSTEENQSGSPPSISRIKKACNSASKDISKDIKQSFH
ncbi:hypothetical protein AB3S75_043467 [Citrus x aurantiifolia]